MDERADIETTAAFGFTIEARDRTRLVADGLSSGFGLAVSDSYNGQIATRIDGFKIEALTKEVWEMSKVGELA